MLDIWRTRLTSVLVWHLRADVSGLVLHWGSSSQASLDSDEIVSEPPKKLLSAMKAAGVPDEDFVSIKIGETLVV